MKIETKLKMLTSFFICSFVLIILFLAIQIGQERRMYQIEKRLNKIENILFTEANNINLLPDYHNIATVDPNDRNDWSTHYRVGQIRDTVYKIDATLKNIDRKLDYRTINVNDNIYEPNTQEIIYGIDYNDAVIDYLDKILKEVTYIRKFK